MAGRVSNAALIRAYIKPVIPAINVRVRQLPTKSFLSASTSLQSSTCTEFHILTRTTAPAAGSSHAGAMMSPQRRSAFLAADAGSVEGGHVVVQVEGRLGQHGGEGGAAPFAQAHAQIEQALLAHGGERAGMAGFG